MKNKPLFVQIWLVFAGITTGICLLLLFVIPLLLSGYFTREIYSTIEEAQQIQLAGRLRDRLFGETPLIERDQEQQSIRTVRHILITDDGRMVPNVSTLPQSFKQLFVSQAGQQKEAVARYVNKVGNDKIYYIIRRETFLGRTVYVLSYMWEEHRNKLVNELSVRLFAIMGLVIVFSWIPALWLAKYLSRPLVKLEEHVKRIADRDWHEPIELDRKDEIGRLAKSMEETRRRLVRQDEAQQSLLQHISHELKTPVMVIRSYVQSIQDGIYPKGDLETSVEVIEKEAERLDKRIRDLLYLTKLDYLSTHKLVREQVKLDKLAEDVAERLRWRRPELQWSLRLEPLTIQGDREQWTIALENLLDNQIRYARERITVVTETGDADHRGGTLTVANDGPPIDPEVAGALFERFRKGTKGEFGLGLAIVKRIATLHHADVRAVNQENGVAFQITF